MENTFLPGTVRQRLADLMKYHKVSQTDLALKIGCGDSLLSRFLTGKTDKIGDENIIRIARVFNVSTDFLLGVTNVPDRKNYEIDELGLSAQAARNLYTGKVNAQVVNRLLESPRFAELTYILEQYFNDTIASGFAAQNQLYATLANLTRSTVQTDAAKEAAKDISRLRTPAYQAYLATIEAQFMAAVKEVKKEIGNDFTAAQSLTRDVTQQMFIELTKGQDVQTPTITPEMISAAVTQSAAGMDGVQKEALDKFGQALTEFLQSTLDHAQEKQNADPEQ